MKKNFTFIWITLAVLFFLFWFYFPTLSKYRDLKEEEERISAELAALDGKITKLTEERDLLKNDVAYLEKVIREELGLVKPGEIVYKFVPEEQPSETEPTLKTPAENGSNATA